MIRCVSIVLLLLGIAARALGADTPADTTSAAAGTATDAKTSPAASAAANERITALITQLSDDDFKVRDRAAGELAALGDDAVAAMKAAVKRADLQPSARNALEGILAKSATRKLTGPTLVSPAPPGTSGAD